MVCYKRSAYIISWLKEQSATLPGEGGNDDWRAACEWGWLPSCNFFFNLHIHSFYLKKKKEGSHGQTESRLGCLMLEN